MFILVSVNHLHTDFIQMHMLLQFMHSGFLDTPSPVFRHNFLRIASGCHTTVELDHPVYALIKKNEA